MGNKDFYSSKSYREKQSLLTKLNWEKGIFNSKIKNVERVCKRPECKKIFTIKPSDPKKYCSSRCAALINNTGRILSPITKTKISKSLTGRSYPERQGITFIDIICNNPVCGKFFKSQPWQHAKYCSNKCAIAVIGGKTTSPKAARAKAGIRHDIDSKIYFYSRWEANYARILNLKKVRWIHQPRRFKLISQYYTPDFYLPETKTYIEIKNFLAPYSQKRDEDFRKLYPKEKLILILKEDYKKLEQKYASLIKEWEFSK